MARRIEQLTIDGVGIDLSKARFADTFDVAESDERRLAFDEEVVYVVVARVSTPSFRESRHGEVSRVNVLKVKEARLVKDEDTKTAILDKIKFDYRPQPSLFDEVEEPEDDDLEHVRIEPEVPEEVDPLHTEDAYNGDEDADFLDEMEAWLEKQREIADDYEDEPESEQVTDRPRVAADARGLRATDPILDKFLDS